MSAETPDVIPAAARMDESEVKVEGPAVMPEVRSEPDPIPARPEPVEEPIVAPVVEEPQAERPSEEEIDADLAITLGRPKTAAAPSGNLAALLQGRSMLVTVEEKAEEEEKELSDTSHLDAPYDADAIQAAWKALAADLREKNKVGLAATLTTGTFEFDDPTIRLTVANHVQYEELKECAAELLHFMRVTVGSGRLALDVQVSEAEVATTFMTPKDRYVKWAQDHPALETLRKRLDLDLG